MPSSSATSGFQPSFSTAWVMSGWRWSGSSTGSGSWTTSDEDPVPAMTASASSRIVYSGHM